MDSIHVGPTSLDLSSLTVAIQATEFRATPVETACKAASGREANPPACPLPDQSVPPVGDILKPNKDFADAQYHLSIKL